MFSKELFDREVKAFDLVKKAVDQMLMAGYEPRIFDNVQLLEMDVMFVGPARRGERSDIRNLKLPYAYLELLLHDEPEMSERLRVLMEARTKIGGEIYALLKEAITKNLKKSMEGANGGNGGDQKFEA
jgi:hypothetical protein